MKDTLRHFFSSVATVARRECAMIWRDSRIRSVVLIAPFVYAGLFCLVYINHSVTEIPVGLLQQDHSSLARTLVRMLDSSPKLRIAYRADSLAELQDLMLAGKIDAAVMIPADFTRQLKHGHSTTVVSYANATAMVSANTAAKGFNEVIQTFSAGVELKTLMKKGERLRDAKEKFMPVKMDLRPLFNPSFNYSNFMVPGLLAAILQQVILLGVALSWTGEKERNTLAELFRVSPNPWALMLGKALPYLVINFVVAEFYLRVLFPLNDIPMEGSWALAIPFTALFIFTIVSWGMWVSGLFKTRLFATQALMFLAMPSFVLSGFTWPRYAMPEAIQFLSHLLPLSYFAGSFRNIYLAAAPWNYVYHDILALLGFAVLNVLLTYWVIQRMKRQHLSA